ncbi:MAG TPA: excinuclease ABC subunit UvrA [Polyangiaceae bacterium]|jgi:excinuclease ABC subunit A|nr:excinuclease ABC subunit UvrA [Polyangiaceae bacterium]
MRPIRLRGARAHNLKNVDLDLAPGQLVALTGPSGAGKSSLALDTLYAEGQRRFVESFSPYARQFLERLERPPMDELAPIAATVAVDRRAPVKSSRSTLATMADLEPYLAGLFGREAIPTCPACGLDAIDTTPRDAAAGVAASHDGARAIVTYPLTLDDAEQFLDVRERLAQNGYRRLVIGGVVREIDEVRPSEATAPGVRVEVVVDRVTVRKSEARRLQEAIEAAWTHGHGQADLRVEGAAPVSVRRGLVCPRCARSFEPPRPGLFSYNSPFGACDACRGFGRVIAVDWAKVIPDPGRSLKAGAIKPWTGASTSWERGVLEKFCKAQKIPLDVPWEKLTAAQRNAVLDGEGSWHHGKYPGVRAWFKWLETRTYKMHVRVLLSRYREYAVCGACEGSRLNATALAYRVAGLDLGAWHALTVTDALERLRAFPARDPQGKRVKEQLESRLGYLDAVGIGYLTLNRQARTLSGGEAQRAGLTTALGAALTGTLFVLDEPTVGLHAADVPALARVLRDLARGGNSVLVVEHEPLVVRACDRVLEMGPGAGPAGGRILFDGTPGELAKRRDLPTGKAWSEPPSSARARRPGRAWLEVRGAREHNLQGVDVRFPLGVLCAVTGPSGSGKSTLVHDVLFRAAARGLGNFTVDVPGSYDVLVGLGSVARAVLVDQSPLGRTARGNPATYVKAWDRVRARFAAEAEASRRGLTAASFSFNVPGGRCEECAGEGYETVEMQFLADVQLLCPVCQGQRFKPEVLAVTHRGKSIADVLAMSIEEALALFDPRDDPDYVLRRLLEPIVKVGLGYLPLGQPLSTLSGGEAQRLKLARALSEDAKGTLFVVDEPSAGLHAQDAAYVVSTLQGLVDDGASVIVVEHDLDVIRACDWVIDLGPGGGPHGGHLVAEGTPEEVAKTDTRTGEALREHARLGARRDEPAKAKAKASSRPPAEAAIAVSHAREHNLKDVSCAIPHGKICVVTGPSGSGKSSLAFDVVFAEGQRRFMETLTPYARQFLPTLPRPDVDAVTGVPPSIALEQRTSRGGANSTVATVTEVAHYLRLLYAKVGELHCPACDTVVAPRSADAVYESLHSKRGSAKHTVYAPAVRARKGTYLDLFTMAARAGVQAARVDGAIVPIDPPPKLAKTKEHTVDLIVYFGKLAELDRATFDRALTWGGGAVRVADGPPKAVIGLSEQILSTDRSCPSCGTGVPELEPRWFSFNTKQGQCEACLGTGVEGGPETIEGWEPPYETCETCHGTRLSALPRGVRMFGQTYAETTARSVASALAQIKGWRFDARDALIAKAPHAELLRRLTFVQQVGLGYLALDRPASTLSGGEMQRLRLSAQLGSGLTGALYVLDEPTIGLHPRDTGRLMANLRQLADMGSTVLVVEHDAETIRSADYLIDIGPTGGRSGGHVVAEGPVAQVLADPRSPTARALEETGRLDRPKRPMADAWIELSGARANNLRNVDFRVPVGRMCVVAGVSGSGKSTLVRHVFYPALRKALGLVTPEPGEHAALKGTKVVKRALAVDQSPIGRTPRSVPATFLGVWDEIRKLYASLPDAKMRGYSATRFSFNTPSMKTAKAGKTGGGRCPACEGQGIIVAEMPFLPDVIAPCEACGGSRFEPSTLEVRFAGLSIGDVLHLPAADAAQVFANHRRIARPLATLADLGVGYVQIGQGSNTLSGGEAQRLKLAAELTAGSAHEPTVYVLDEPTTGLHLSDVRRLLGVLERLVARGDTLVVIEHHPDVIASADWVVELGPEAGEEGGRVVFEGEPRKLARARTATGKVLASEAPAAAE